MPWLASRSGVEDLPADGPHNCRVIVFDCISYSVSYMRILTIDEDRRTALSQESESNTCALHEQRTDASDGSLLQYVFQGNT